jgi:two-component system nitrate/nitrite response regulator NarL
MLRPSPPDVVLLDVDLGPQRALEFLHQAKLAGFSGRILIVTAGIDDREAMRLIEGGVAGILHKHHGPEVLCQAIRQVASGEVYLEKRYLKTMFLSVDSAKTDPRPRLSDRDVGLLRLIFQGLSNKEIGERLSLSESTVKASLRLLFDKLAVQTRSQLVRVALEQFRDQL